MSKGTQYGIHFPPFQILDVERMLAKSATPHEVIAMETPQQAMENHPVIRTLYDHSGVSDVTCISQSKCVVATEEKN